MTEGKKHIIRLIYFFALLLISVASVAQVPNLTPDTSLKDDTLEVIESDSTIIYIVEGEPITIRDTFKIEKPKKKLYLHFSLAGSIMAVQQFVKAKPSFENYVSKLNAANTTKYGYTMGATIWMCPKKTFVGATAEFMTIKQRFKHTLSSGENIDSDNRFKYVNTKMIAGRWFRRGNKVSYALLGSVNPVLLFSYAGFTLLKSDPSRTTRLNTEIKYKKLQLDYSVYFKILLNYQNMLLELEPYATISPHSSTSKDEVYTVRRTYIGLRAGIVTKLF